MSIHDSSINPIEEKVLISNLTNKFALVVGVNNSSSSSYLPNLQSAENDALDICWALRQQACNFTSVKLLQGDTAKTHDVLNEIIKLVQNKTEHDFLLFYFIGHGQPAITKEGERDVYFVTYDFDPHQVRINKHRHLSMRQLYEVLYEVDSIGGVLIVLDCCYAGDMITPKTDVGRIRIDVNLDVRRIIDECLGNCPVVEQKDRLRVILTSTRRNSNAQERVLTNLMLPALQGDKIEALDPNTGDLNIHSLFMYLREKMQQDQLPNLSGEFAGNWILANYPEKSRDFLKKSQQDEENTLRDVVSELKDKLKVITDPNYFEKLTGTHHSQPFDHILCNEMSLDDLDMERVAKFFQQERTQKQQDFRIDASIEELLKIFGLLHNSSPTYGALLCFGKNPQKKITGAFIRCTYYKGKDRQIGWISDEEYRGNLIDQFESCSMFLRKSLRLSRIISREGRAEYWEIPFAALEEALANALTHREYANRNEFVHVEIFDDRVEINSPGDLPPPMTLQLLEEEHKSHPRNPQIARVFYLYHYGAEQVGSGIQRIRDAMEEAGLPPPKIRVRPDKICSVVLSRPKQVPEEIVISERFGKLLSEGIEAIAKRRKKDLNLVEDELSKSMGEETDAIIRRWKRGIVPSKQAQLASLASACVQLGGMDQAWLRTFLKVADYPEVELLVAELFPKTFLSEFVENFSKIRNIKVRRRTFVSIILILTAFLLGFFLFRLSSTSLWLNLIISSISKLPVSWIITLSAIFFPLLVILISYYLWRQRKILLTALTTANNLIDLDDSLLRLLASWIRRKNHDVEIKLLLSEVLRDACREFMGHVHRATLFLPDGEYLVPWAYTGMPIESITRAKFSIGNDANLYMSRGVVGKTFLERTTHIAHINQVNETWVCDDDNYIRFSNKNYPPAYRAFICVPVIGVSPSNLKETSSICLGVVCFDSLDKKIFDSTEVQIFIRVIARRIAATLLIYEMLKES